MVFECRVAGRRLRREARGGKKNERRPKDKRPGTQVSLIPVAPGAGGQATVDDGGGEVISAGDWLSRGLADDDGKYSTHARPAQVQSRPRAPAAAVRGGEAHLVGTIFGRTNRPLAISRRDCP